MIFRYNHTSRIKTVRTLWSSSQSTLISLPDSEERVCFYMDSFERQTWLNLTIDEKYGGSNLGFKFVQVYTTRMYIYIYSLTIYIL